jgi:hypothetical protein
MESYVNYVKQINDVFENVYVDRSIVICRSLDAMHHVAELLEAQDYPVAIVTIFNTKEPIAKFVEGKVRMLIMSESLIHVIREYMPDVYNITNVIFSLEGVHFENADADDKKIFSLNEL